MLMIALCSAMAATITRNYRNTKEKRERKRDLVYENNVITFPAAAYTVS